MKTETEETKPRPGYYSGYKPKDLAQQINRLRELFPRLGDVNHGLLREIENGNLALPKGAEGFFAIPNRYQKRATRFRSFFYDLLSPSYPSAVEKVLKKIAKTRSGKFNISLSGGIDGDHLYESGRTFKSLEELSVIQGNPDILIFPAQFGNHYSGQSVFKVYDNLNTEEFGLSSYCIGFMLLTNQERLQHNSDIHIDCAGDSFHPDRDPDFDIGDNHTPLFHFNDGIIWFGSHKTCAGSSGSATGFTFPYRPH